MTQKAKSPTIEYIILIALISSIVALGTDIMLPALSVIGDELGAPNKNAVHYVVTTFFLGFGLGQLVVGPLSDSYGRKPIVYAGFLIFVLGCAFSIFFESWAAMLIGRCLQGLGASARIVSVALIRDEYEGRPMARIMSVVFSVFILVPMIAPALGQVLIHLGGWRLTFVVLALFAIILVAWFGFRQPETLSSDSRRPLNTKGVYAGYKEVASNRAAFGYTIAAGLIFGAFTGYLGTAQKIFQEVFEVGDLFALYFAFAAASIGIASLLNAAMVMRFGMFALSLWALIFASVTSIIFALVLIAYSGVPPLAMFMIWLLGVFFCMGIIFANLNALAMEPMGHMAGFAAAFVGAISTLISLPFAAIIGNAFNGTVFPLVIAFAVLGTATVIGVVWTEGGFSRRRSND